MIKATEGFTTRTQIQIFIPFDYLGAHHAGAEVAYPVGDALVHRDDEQREDQPRQEADSNLSKVTAVVQFLMTESVLRIRIRFILDFRILPYQKPAKSHRKITHYKNFIIFYWKHF